MFHFSLDINKLLTVVWENTVKFGIWFHSTFSKMYESSSYMKWVMPVLWIMCRAQFRQLCLYGTACVKSSACFFLPLWKTVASPSVYCGGGNSRKIISVSVIAHAEARSVREALHEFRHLWGSSGKSCASAEIWRGQYIRMTSHKSDTSNLSPLHLPRLWENGDELLIEGLGLAKNNTYNIKFSQWLVSNRCRLRKPVAINY